jgi:ubiquinone/menaquinone biosynthesis C-methylase UbiE
MNLQRFIAAQFRQPSGWFGARLFSRFMNRVNRRIIEQTIALLDLSPQHHVLDIGFGGGISLSLLAPRLTGGSITGVDISPDMVHAAERRFAPLIAQQRVRVMQGDVTHLPFASATFDRVFTVNTIYFWANAAQGVSEIHRVLKPGGRAAISIRSGDKMSKYRVTQYNFRLFSPDEVATLMQQAGFKDLRIDHRDRDRRYDQVIIAGTK